MINYLKSKSLMFLCLLLGSLILVPIVFATSSNFLQKATEYYQRRCTEDPERLSRSRAFECYLFDKVQELDSTINNLGQEQANQATLLNNLQTSVESNSVDITALKGRKSIIDIAQVRGAQFNTTSTMPVSTPDAVNISCDIVCLLWVEFYVDTRNSLPSANPAGNYNFYSIFVDGFDQAVFNQASLPVPNAAVPLSLNGVFPVAAGNHTVQIYAWTNGGQLQSFESALQVLAIANSSSPSTCVEPPPGLISWWPGDGNAEDMIGTNEGNLQNGATFASGQIGQAFSFDGIDDFLQAPTDSLPTGNSDRTLEMWVRVNEFLADVPDSSSPLETFFAGYGNFGSSGQIYTLGTAGNVYYFSQWGGAIFGPSLVIDRWYHIAVTNSGTTVNLFLDGIVVTNGTLGINTSTNTQFYIGRAPGSFGDIRRLNGFADEVTIYNRALTQNEIQSIFDAGSNGKCK